MAVRTNVRNGEIPRPNFLAIDEGFGNLDSSNLNSIFRLFDYLKTEFDYIIIISHIDAMRDITDNLIDINTSTGLSNVVHN